MRMMADDKGAEEGGKQAMRFPRFCRQSNEYKKLYSNIRFCLPETVVSSITICD
jgi:hypothetical protein